MFCEPPQKKSAFHKDVTFIKKCGGLHQKSPTNTDDNKT